MPFGPWGLMPFCRLAHLHIRNVAYRCVKTIVTESRGANLKEKVRERDIVTTHFIRQINPGLLPWKYALLTALKPLIKLRLPKTLYRNLTFFCHAFEC